MSITPAFRDGLRRVWSSPALMVLLAVLFPAVFFLAFLGFDMVGVTGDLFSPELGTINAYPFVFELLVVYSIIRAWCTGGILHRYAQSRPMRAGAFQRVCGTFFFRLLRLHLLSALILGGCLYVWLYYQFGYYLVLLGLGYIFCDIVLDYAKIRTVVEDRRSMVFAAAAGFRFAVRRPGAVVRLYLLNAAIAVIVLGIGGYVASELYYKSAGFLIRQDLVSGPLMTFSPLHFMDWEPLLIIFTMSIVHLVWFPLLFLATQTAFFQDELAYPGYTAGSGVNPADLPVTEVVAGPPTDGV